MMRKRILLLTFILLLFSNSISTFAGECIETEEYYFEELERISDVNQISKEEENNIYRTISCIYDSGRFRLASEYPEDLESLSAVEEIKKEHKETEKLCFKVIPKLLKSTSLKLRCEAVKVLAYYGWPGSFELLMQCDGSASKKATLFSMLGDKRAIPWVIRKYKRADKEHRDNPAYILHSKMVYLNTLYHLASSEQLPFVNEIINSPNPAKIRSRAILVRDRIYELYPKTMKPQATKNVEWEGKYIFGEFGGKNTGILISYSINVYKKNGVLIADIDADGFQTEMRISCTTTPLGNRIDLYFDKYREDNLYEIYKPGEMLLSFEKKGSKILTYWAAIKPQLIPFKNGRVYFAKE
jgi:hypothetical protein